MRTPSGSALAGLIPLLACAALPAGAAAAPEFLSAAAESGFALAAGLPAPVPAALRAQAAPPPPGTPFLSPAPPAAAPTAAVPLPALLDNVARTRTTFRAGGLAVHVFGQKSRNKGDWFIGFAADDGAAQWRNGHKMIHWMLVKKTVQVKIGAASFSAYVQGQIVNRMQSRLVVTPDDRSSPASNWSIQEISDAGYEAGYPLRLHGREYRLFYTRDFDQGPDGEFSGYTNDRSIVLVTRSGGRFTAYHWFQSEVPRDQFLFVSKPAAFADDGAETLRLGLRLRPDGVLEIYDLAAPPAA